MGIASILFKTLGSGIKTYGKKALLVLTDDKSIFEETLSKGMKTADIAVAGGAKEARGFRKFGQSAKDAMTELEKEQGNKSLWAHIGGKIKAIFTDTWKAGKESKGLWKGTKAVSSTLFKKMPLLGTLGILVGGAYSILNALFSGGVGDCAHEVCKTAATTAGSTGGMIVGGAIGALFGGFGAPIGAIVGGAIGEWVSDFFTGKSFADKQEEAQNAKPQEIPTEVAKPQVAQQAMPQAGTQQVAMAGAKRQVPTTFAFNPKYIQAQDIRQQMLTMPMMNRGSFDNNEMDLISPFNAGAMNTGFNQNRFMLTPQVSA